MMASKSAVLPSEDIIMSDTRAPNIPNKTKTDFIRIVSPSRKTLASLDAQLIIGVLDDCIQQMGIVCVLPTILSCPETLSVSLGQEVVKALKEHHTLEERYQAMMLDKNVDGSELEEKQAKSIKAVQDSLRNILRLLRRSLKTGKMLEEVGPIKGEEMGSRKLRDGLCELKEVVLERLLTTSAEEQKRSKKMEEVRQRHNKNQEQVDSLERDVALAIKDRDTEISTLTSQMQELKNSLHQMEQGLEEFVVRTQQEAEKQSQSDRNTSEGKRAHMQQEADHMRAQLNIDIANHREKELALRKKKHKMETEIENLIQKYDAEMGEKQTEVEKISRIYEEEKAELRELEEHCADLDLEYSQIMEERQEAQEQREQQERERELHSRAAIVIQAHWRGFCVRKAMKAKEKPKKAKKGKGKKGNTKKNR
ncbi:dynein regulatory complex protein 10 [Misgurnus anguillicaudatus]|uniref:dynein regulatory complex protein 10 n=1 Tax=Misgurnus anguillicaudatus TaxID=75329 RepID=UPI003CCFDDF5